MLSSTDDCKLPELMKCIPEVFTPHSIIEQYQTCKEMHTLYMHAFSNYIEGNEFTLLPFLPKIDVFVPPGEGGTRTSNFLKCRTVVLVNHTGREYMLCNPTHLINVLIESVPRWEITDKVQVHPYVSPSSVVDLHLNNYNFYLFNHNYQYTECKYILDSYTGTMSLAELKVICEVTGVDPRGVIADVRNRIINARLN